MRFIDEGKINDILDGTAEFNDREFSDIISKAKELKGLSLWEAGVLLNAKSDKHIREMCSAAKFAKKSIYGNRLVLFAPLYVSNFCNNNCLYCGFRKDNKLMERSFLSVDELKSEVERILSQGHKRILMLMGEDFSCFTFDRFLEYLDIVYSVVDEKGNGIRRVNIEIPSLTAEQFAHLKRYKLGTYTVFQETYHHDTYSRLHPSGAKADYDFRLNVMDRALSNGLNDVGIGALFGLYDYRFEVLALLMHANHLDATFGTGPHTISVPRVEHVENVNFRPAYKVSDEDFKKLVAVLRLAVPYTGIILSTRESVSMRDDLFSLGVSQVSAGSHTEVGGYSDSKREKGQFTLNDFRGTGQVIGELINQNQVPSFCTACYRVGRVGKDFMDLAKPGLIRNFCQPNALLTLQEYLEDYADSEVRKKGEELIERELQSISNEERRDEARKRLDKIKNGERDLYF